MRDVSLIVGEHQAGERQGDDHAQHPHQRTPDGEGEKDDGRIEAGDVPHDARYDEAVLYDLHHRKDHNGRGQNDPEVAARIGRLQYGKHDGRDEAHHLQVGNHVEQADEEAQTDSQREVDNQETDAEEDADTECHEGLSAEIAVHGLLYIGKQMHHMGAVFQRDEVNPPLGNALVVEQDEDHIEQNEQEGEEAEEQVDRLRQQLPDAWQALLQCRQEVLLMEQTAQVVRIDILPQELAQRTGHIAAIVRIREIGYQQVLHPAKLFEHGRNKEVENRSTYHQQREQRTEDGKNTHLHTQAILEEGDHGIDHIGNEPCDEEGEQHAAQPLEQHQQGDDDAAQYDTADETVEGDFLLSHGCSEL